MKLALVFLAMLFGMSAAAQSDRFDKVEIKTTRLTQNLYLLEGEGGNIGVSAGDDGVFVIDDQFAPLTCAHTRRDQGDLGQAGAFPDQHPLAFRPHRRQ
jgi:hypothetical protein